tara:strand:+ start:3447 stop:5042 length:1596 start_codon:yes stop_codon:yes gene_type:complete
MSRINVNTISGIGGTFVQLTNGATGDASKLTFPPTIIGFSPEVMSDTSQITTNIQFTFNQNIEFSGGTGTIELRTGSATGSIVESYSTGSSSNLSLNANVLTINPSSDLTHDTTYYVTLPSVGIANTFGAFYKGSTTYNFKTKVIDAFVTGGNYAFSKIDSNSPTGFYRYHIFTGTSTFTLSHPAPQFLDMQWVLSAGGGSGGPGYSPGGACGGGGGAGGVINGSGPTFGAPAGTYTVTIGAGASRAPYSGHSKNPAYYGTPSSITGSPGTLHTVNGGGSGGSYPQTPSYAYGNPGGSGGGGCGPGYSSWPTHPSYPTNGYTSFSGGSGMPGQGHQGGYGTASYNPNYGHYYTAGGGGGAGGNGGNSARSPWPGPIWPSYPNHPNWNSTAGNGGSGKSTPAFAGPILLGMVPDSAFPASVLVDTYGNGLGPTGRMGGGGGGGAASPVPFSRAGNGGTGGGGHGAYVRPGQYNPSPFQPRSPAPSPNPHHAEDGVQYLGGGGGGGTSPNPSTYRIGGGGSGSFMIRYAVNQL